MDILTLARWQFGITTIYHFLFVPLTLGLSVLVAVMQTFYYRTNNDVYKQMALFWGKLFVINFTLGLVTGIVQEFQFGMNWSEYSRFVGDIFGIPLAIEALMAFFLESTFLGLWLFGWNKLPKSIHLLSIWLVAIGANLSSLWILSANAWMQRPVGYVINNGRAELADIVAVFLNERMLVQAQHTILAGFVTGGLFVLGISAWQLLRRHKVDMFSRSAKIALVFTAVTSILVATSGHSNAQVTAKYQPMKMAAMEALWESEAPASFSLFALIDQENRSSRREIRLPFLLSVLAYNNMTEEVKGIKELQAQAEAEFGPGNYIPPVAVTYWSFRIMVGLGLLFILGSFLGLVAWWRNNLENNKFFLRLSVVLLFMPYIANASGWIVTEMGRQPWVVYGLLKTADAVSPNVGAGTVLFSLIGFGLVYGVLAVVDFYLLAKYAELLPQKADTEGSSETLETYAY